MESTTATFHINEHIAQLVLSRPQQANALNAQLLHDITTALGDIAKSQARVLLITGDGKHFCGGADLRWLVESADSADSANSALTNSRQIAAMLDALWAVPFPTIAAVQGASYGGGVGLAAAADICIATESAKFCCSEVKIGLIPAIVSPYIIRAIGERQAARYFMSAEIFNSKQAAAMGLVHEITADDMLISRANEIAAAIATNAPQAVQNIKQHSRESGRQQPSPQQSQQNANALAAAIDSKEARAGIAAFFSKQLPPWQIKKTDNLDN